jgi:cytochrome b6-f complex iron-sulfur subunit
MAEAAAKTPAPAAGRTPAKPAEQVRPQGVTRREFLYYIWGASIALALAETTGAVIWFILPQFRAGEFGAPYTVDAGLIPPPDGEPVGFPALRFWLVNVGPQGAQLRATNERPKPGTGELQGTRPGIVALYTVCTHLGCLYKWVPTNHRFECPCHGSKYNINGTYIEGPTPRSLDRMLIQAVDAGGQVLAESDASVAEPFELPQGATQLIVQTGKIVRGLAHG